MRQIALAAALALIAAPALSQQVVRMGTEGGYPPYNLINDAGEVDGFERELGDELCARASLTCEWVVTEWDSIIPNLQSGNFDTIIAAMNITEERDAVIDFTEAYVPPAPSAYAAASEDVDLAAAVISAQTATLHAAHVAQSGATLVEFATPEETVAAVRDGEVDAVFADKDFLAPFVAESGGALVFVGDEPQLGEGIGMGVRESDTELKAKFNEAIAAMKADGSLNALIRKWFGEEAPVF